jgi:hypothetical protein
MMLSMEASAMHRQIEMISDCIVLFMALLCTDKAVLDRDQSPLISVDKQMGEMNAH